MDPARAERLARALAEKLPADIRDGVEVVVSPAMGGVIIGHEMGRALGKPAMFVERPQGTFELRRGFRLSPASACFWSRMSSPPASPRAKPLRRSKPPAARSIGAASLVDRSGGNADLGVPYTPLIRIDVPAYSADALPPELASIPAVKPGSRAAA